MFTQQCQGSFRPALREMTCLELFLLRLLPWACSGRGPGIDLLPQWSQTHAQSHKRLWFQLLPQRSQTIYDQGNQCSSFDLWRNCIHVGKCKIKANSLFKILCPNVTWNVIICVVWLWLIFYCKKSSGFPDFFHVPIINVFVDWESMQ